MDIREIAERVSKRIYVEDGLLLSKFISEKFAEALIAELAKKNPPVYVFRRKGLDDFCTCDERRYNELAQKPTLFEVKVLYTLPPTAEQIEHETAEACAKVYFNTYDLTDIADDIRSGKWREYL